MGMFLCLCFAPCPRPGHPDGKLEDSIFQRSTDNNWKAALFFHEKSDAAGETPPDPQVFLGQSFPPLYRPYSR